LRAAIVAGNASQAQSLLSETVSVIDKSVQKGVLHRNTAARHKARLTTHVNKLAAK
jgi:small subunit ribosomal protein S20